MKVILLAGGSGSRLFPLSTSKKPKQFLKLFNQKSTFELALERALELVDETEIIIVTNENFVVFVEEQLQGKKCSILVESCSKNTMGAITFALLYAKEEKKVKEDLFLVLCSDHLIEGQSFYEKINQSKTLAKNNIVLFGKKPTRIETGYGYIHIQDETVLGFTEKPDEEKAKSFIEDGNYVWNLGIFFFSQSIFEELLFKHCKAHAILYQLGFSKFRENFSNLPSISFDYAILEKANKRKCVLLEEVFWSDVGSFDAMYEIFQKDEKGNALSENTHILDSSGNLVMSEKRVFLVDCENLIVIEHEDQILITKRKSSQKVKEIVKELTNS